MSLQEQLLSKYREDELVDIEYKTVDGVIKRVSHVKREDRAVRNPNLELRGSFSPIDKVAIMVTDRVGTFGFFIVVLAWTIVWLGWNTMGPVRMRYDPAPAFVLWLFVSNMIQLMLMPLIMVGQNLQGRHSELRAEADFEVNLKAEKEVETILMHLEDQTAQIERQGELILEILTHVQSGKPGAQPVCETKA